MAAVVFGILWSLKYGNVTSLIITFGFSACVILVLPGIPLLLTTSLIVYIAFTLFAMIYGLTKQGFKTMDRTIMLIITTPVFLYWVFALNHFQGAGMMKLLTIISIVGFIFVLIKGKRFKHELGFLAILCMDAITLLFA